MNLNIDELFVGGEPVTPLDALGTWLGSYLYKQSLGLKYKSSNSLTHVWKCKSKNCCWEIKFTKSEVTQKWKIKHLKDSHIDCTLISQPSQRVVETSLKKLILSDTITPTQLLEQAVKIGFKWGVPDVDSSSSKVSAQTGYHMAWRILNQIRLNRIDCFEDGFGFLASYLKHLKHQNPGCIISAEADPHNNNQRAFIMLRGQAVCAEHCKPIISYDGGFLKVCCVLLMLVVQPRISFIITDCNVGSLYIHCSLLLVLMVRIETV
jgi:hypothetical protein